MIERPKYTEEELAKLPQTQQIFNRPDMAFDDHEWRQQGYMVTDICSPARPDCHHVGIPIPTGTLLIKTANGYQLTDETDSTARQRK